METPYAAADDIQVIPSSVALPGYGVVPVNAFLLKGSEPLLVDTGVGVESDRFFETLCTLIDPADLRWLWLTHADPDHVGSLARLLAAAPRMRLITTFLGTGKLGLFMPVPLERLYLLNPGQSIDIGDRRLTAVKPPTFDAPETTAFLDTRSGALVSSDCFGALLQAHFEDARQIPEADLAEAQRFWATFDSPWVHNIDRAAFARSLDAIRALSPSLILSSHLPMAPGLLDRFLETLASVPDHAPFVGPDQAAMAQMLAQMGP